ncbi:MAG: protein kinase [Sandaracinaceae bacterium]|nr:protein kinase [Sandaracinaceae bacterium]
MQRSAWAEALERFAAADSERALVPDDLRTYAEAAVWCARPDLARELHERACAALEAAGNRAEAALVALSLCQAHANQRQMAIASGWLRRAERLLTDLPEHTAHGRLAWTLSMIAQGRGDLDASLEQAERALGVAERTGDRDGLALALLRRGRVLIKRARVDQGMADIDEAMVAAVGGELSPYVTGIIYCATISACNDLWDYDRAGEWTEAARRWCERKSITGFPGICRVHRAEILRLRGRFDEAEREAIQASEELRAFGALDIVAEAFYEIGEIRMRTGDLDAAAEAFRQAHELGRDPQPGLALLWLERGRVETACGLITRALAEAPASDPLRRVRLLPGQVEIALAAGDVATATRAADELDAAVALFSTPGIQAAASNARGAVAIAVGDTRLAITSLRRACALWQQMNAPFEAAQARLLLASAYRAQGDEEAAQLETNAARSTLERLGAAIGLQRTAAGAVRASAPTPEPIGDAPPAPGDLLDERIELLRLVGRGGMGMVFEGRNLRTGRHVAVKLLRRDLATDPSACQRLLQEALACGRIQHPNVIDVFDAGIHRSQPFLVMELLRGESLGARLDRDARLAIGEAVRVVQLAVAGLGAAHRAGIVHRDIKPDNIFLTRACADDEIGVKVLDFRDLEAHRAGVEAHRHEDGHDRRHAALHVAGAGGGEEGHRRAHGCLRHRRGPVPRADRGHALPRRELQRPARGDPHDGCAATPLAPARDPPRPRGGDPARDGPQPGDALREHGRARRRPRRGPPVTALRAA